MSRDGASPEDDLIGSLPATGTCDLTTVGRRSGEPRTVEIWYVVHDGRLHIVGTPGTRGWQANLAANPRARLTLRDPTRELDVVAQLVRDPAERARLTDTAWRVQPWYAEQKHTRADWVSRSPMVALTPVD